MSETTQQGLFEKYEVYKDGEPVEDCFVLEPEVDEAASEALLAYASATDDEDLKQELRDWAYQCILGQDAPDGGSHP